MLKKRYLNELLEWGATFIVAAVVATLLRVYFFTTTKVSGDSMLPTLHNKNLMFLNDFDYKVDGPKRFDIVVFHAPKGKDYIKRVIGLPGETVEIKDDQLYINGKLIPEPYLDEYKKNQTRGPLTRDYVFHTPDGLTTIPKDEYFVMGDNRQNSTDSREIGSVSIQKIIGHTNLVYWPIRELRFVR